MKKKRTRKEREEAVERELAAMPSTKLLMERIAYRQRMAEEERRRRERPLWRRLLPG
jgi:hypothetical protein